MNDLTVQISAPVGHDAAMLSQVLHGAGIESRLAVATIGDMCESERDSAGALLIAEEALNDDLISKLATMLATQPPWSDLPVLLLSPSGSETSISQQRERDRLPLEHLTILERPLRPSSLLSAVQTALRARRRQFELRDTNKQRDQAFEDLRTSEERSRLILESTHDCIKLLDLEGHLLTMNEEGQRRLGIDDFNKVCGTSWPDLWNGADKEAAQAAIARALRGKAGRFEGCYDVPHSGASWWDISVTPVRDRTGVIVNLLAVSREITSRKLAEHALLQSEKLAAVGRLASSISHEINNPLEAVTNLLYIALHHYQLPREVEETLQLADAELGRAAHIVGQTLRFHHQSTHPKRTTPEDLTSSVIVLYRGRLVNSNIQVEIDHAPELQFTCFEGEIRQVLSNLVGNAIDAMQSGGRLLIRSRCSVHRRTERKGVSITIADTGQGMEHAVAKRIFEAFYSTKGDNGTGLGLWITQGIVEKHKGHLSVRSKPAPGGGTVFRLFLPAQYEQMSGIRS